MFDKLDLLAATLLLSLSWFHPRSFPSTFFSHQLSVLSSHFPRWLVAFSSFSTETYWLHWRSRAVLHKSPPPLPQNLFVFEWACPCGNAAAWINAQISTIFLLLHVCQMTCCKGITRCLTDAARRWKLPHHLSFASRRTARNQMAAT